MAENTNNKNEDTFEQMLKEFAEAQETAAEAKDILKEAAYGDALKESLEEDDDQMEESQEEINEEDDDEQDMSDAEDEVEDEDDVEEVDVDDEGEEIEDSEEELEVDDDTEGESEMESDFEDETENPLYQFQPDSNGDYDLTHIDDVDQLENIIKNAPDGAKIVLVKNSSFDVEVTPDGDEDNFDMEDEEPTDSLEGAFKESDDMEESYDEDINEGEEESSETEDENEEGMNENVQKLIAVKDKKIGVYEGKIRKMQKALKSLYQQNKALNEEKQKLKGVLTESKKYMDKLVLINKNLAFSSKLFTEHATTKTEKQEIIEEFDKANTIRESQIIYDFYKKQLNKKSTPKAYKEQIVSEAKNAKKPKKIVKESVSYKKDQTQSAFSRLSGVKTK